jgi:hypothetical protein
MFQRPNIGDVQVPDVTMPCAQASQEGLANG